MLNIITHGAPTDRPPLLIAHGLYGSAKNWGVIAKRMSGDRLVQTFDMRNHGLSDWNDTHSYIDLAHDLNRLARKTTDVLGHSMGGKAVMTLALTQPEHLRRIVIADIAPVAYGHTQQPMIDAMRSIDLSLIETRRDADEALAGVLEDPGVRAFLLQSLDVTHKKWRLNLDVLEAEMPNIMGFPAIDGVFDGPALFLSGAESDYVGPEHRDRIKSLFPKARFAKIPGASHWLHADKPREFEATVAAFLNA